MNLRLDTIIVDYGADAATVGDELTEIKSDLNKVGALDRSYIDFNWECGGIDNATGETNNDGVSYRSRDVTYYKVNGLMYVNNASSSTLWIIGYTYSNGSYTFSTSQKVTAGTTYTGHPADYIRFDIRGNLTEASLVVAQTYTDLVYSVKELQDVADSVDYKTDKTYGGTSATEILSLTAGYTWYSSGSTISSTKRACSDAIQIVPNMAYLSVSSGYYLYVYGNNKGEGSALTSISSGWSSFFDIASADYKYLFVVIKRSDGDVITSDDLSSALTLVTYTEEIPYELSEEVIPYWWDGAITTAEDTINEYLLSDEDSASFAFVTDTHIEDNAGNSGLLLNKVMKDCHIPVWFHGGDAVTSSQTISKDAVISAMESDFEQFKKIESIGLRAIGNHDPVFTTTDTWDSNLTNGEINHYYHGVDREKYLQVYGAKKGYFYKDIAKDKLRCIVLDIVPYASQVDSDELVTGSNKMYFYLFGSEQLDWFADVLASTPQDYKVVVCSHISPVHLNELRTIDEDWNENTPTDYLQCRKIAEAYALKSTYTFSGTLDADTTGDTYAIDVDFSAANGDFVCFICGHTHKDFMLTLDNVHIVGTANDSLSVSSNVSTYAPSKTEGTDTEQIIDFYCILPNSNTVKVVRLGAYLADNGLVRTFTY